MNQIWSGDKDEDARTRIFPREEENPSVFFPLPDQLFRVLKSSSQKKLRPPPTFTPEYQPPLAAVCRGPQQPSSIQGIYSVAFDRVLEKEAMVSIWSLNIKFLFSFRECNCKLQCWYRRAFNDATQGCWVIMKNRNKPVTVARPRPSRCQTGPVNHSIVTSSDEIFA